MRDPPNEIIVYQPDETIRLEVRLENETVWLTQMKIADLFGVQKAAISKHLKNIYTPGELAKETTVSKMETVHFEGNRKVTRIQEYYNLDVIIAVGYRVNSLQATRFRIWATTILKEYLLRGYAVNERLDRLENRMTKAEERYTCLSWSLVDQANQFKSLCLHFGNHLKVQQREVVVTLFAVDR